MKEIFEFRISRKFEHLLFEPEKSKKNIDPILDTISIVQLERDDPKFKQMPIVSQQVETRYDSGFFFGWEIKRKYNKQELTEAVLFGINIKSTFEPAGEECGTEYNSAVACEICRANGEQVGPLRLRRSSIPKKDIARTIAGEVVVSTKFKETFESNALKGINFEQVYSKNKPIDFFQPIPDSPNLKINENTIAGVNPFDLSETDGGEVYKCPKGHMIGLNLLSEVYVQNIKNINDFDFFQTNEKIGVKRGLLRPEPMYLCSPKFRNMVIKEKLKGFNFEVAHIE